MANTPASVIKKAQAELGKTDGTKYGKWYAKYTGSGSYYGEKGVPWCAMFVSWVFCNAPAKKSVANILPRAYCPYIVNAGKKHKMVKSVKNAKKGDIVLFDWGGDGVADHVGIVKANYTESKVLATIEGNTGGMVKERKRAYSTVCCIIRPKWATAKKAVEAVKAAVKPSTTVSYKGKVTAKVGLNCRKGAGTKYAIVTTYAHGEVVTITAEKNGWGKTGKGWVYLDYIRKVS